MIINIATSTITLGGRTFPACVLVCPIGQGDEHTTERERSLGGVEGPGTAGLDIRNSVYVPLENGLLVEVEQPIDKFIYDVNLRCPTCSPVRSDGDVLWLPETVAVYGNQLVPEPRPAGRGLWSWRHGEAEWVAELIERLSKMAFEIPLGPRVTLKPLSFAFPQEVEA